MSADLTVVLVGPHAAGKTTLGRLVSARHGIPFHEEIGKQLRFGALARDPGAHCMLQQNDFDQLVTDMEMGRDRSSSGVRIVETWHLGNLAYAAERSPQSAPLLAVRIARHLNFEFRRVLIQPLEIGIETSFARLSEPGPDAKALVNFFNRVFRRTMEFALEFGFEMLPSIRTDAHGIGEAAQMISDAIVGSELEFRCHGRQIPLPLSVMQAERNATPPAP